MPDEKPLPEHNQWIQFFRRQKRTADSIAEIGESLDRARETWGRAIEPAFKALDELRTPLDEIDQAHRQVFGETDILPLPDPPESVKPAVSISKQIATSVITLHPVAGVDPNGDTTVRFDGIKAERRRLRDEYIATCRAGGVKVTNEKIAEAASPKWHGSTAITKWLQCDPRYNGAPDKLIRKVFIEKTHLRSRT